MKPTKTMTVDIAAPFNSVMAELSNPALHPSWATNFFVDGAEQLQNGEVRVDVPRLGGTCRMKIESDEKSGSIDVFLASGDEPFGRPLPVRVIENESGATVLWTLSQFPGMPDEMFESGCASMQLELNALKTKLEDSA